MNKKPELLAPIQDYTSLSAAIENGADAVYFGIEGFNMRSTAKNFTVKDLPKITRIAHQEKVKVYLAINIIIYEEEIKKLEIILKKVKEAKVDAIICWDLAVIKIAKKLGIEIHLSTQASVANSEAAEFYRKLGVTRAVLARECSIDQIKKIKKKTKIEIEVFIHGAMCVSISGRCFMSQHLYGKSANRGECLQPCRRKYIVKQKVDDKELELGENYILSPKDLSTIEFIEKIIFLDVDCLKIEGRNRSPEYVAATTKAYRTAIDFITSNKRRGKKFKDELAKLKKDLAKDLSTIYHRGSGSGFFLGKPIDQWANSYGNQATTRKIHIGRVTGYYKKIGVVEIMIQANKTIKIGDTLVFQGSTTGSYQEKISSLEKDHQSIKKAHQGDKVAIKIAKPVRKNDEVYIVKKV